MIRPLALAMLLFAVSPCSDLLAQAPAVTHLVPSAVMPGKPTDVIFYGSNLAGASGVWLSIEDAEVQLTPDVKGNGADAAKVSYRITIPNSAPPSIVAARVATDKGISAPALLMIDDLPSGLDSGKNKTPQTAQEVSLPVAVDGACEAESYDFYRFRGSKGQRVSVEVVARRLGSSLDPVVRLLDPEGRELAYSDDESGLDGDGRLAVQIPADGDYLIELRDIQYTGGAQHRYRLRIGNFPLVGPPFPLAVSPGASSRLELAFSAGASSDAVQLLPVEVSLPAAASRSRYSVAARLTDGHGSTMLSVATGMAMENLEKEPNNSFDQATPVTFPSGINGRFEQPRDKDHYRFEAEKGQRLVFQGVTRQLRAATDLFMRLEKPDGSKLAEAEDAGTGEGVINYTFPADGTYQLVLEDLLRRGGPEFVYRVEVQPYQAGFSLALESHSFSPPKEGVFVAKVTCARRDYSGPITLELEDAGEGFDLRGNIIAKDKNETTLRVTVPAGLAPGHFQSLRIVGHAKIGETEYRAVASTAVGLNKLFPMLAYPPVELLDRVAIGIGPVFPEFFKLSVDKQTVEVPQVVGGGSLKVKAEKLNKFGDAISLAVEGLPDGIAAEVKPIAKGKADGVIDLKGGGKLPEGEHSLRIVGTATFQDQPKRVVLDNVMLRVVAPLAVTAGNASLAPGKNAKLKVTVTRHGEAKDPITVSVKNLPDGVRLAEDGKIPAGKNEVELTLTANDDAAAAKAEDVVVVAVTKVKEQEVSAESQPLTVEIKAP